MNWLLIPLAILAGLMNPVQSGCNAAINKALERPVMTACVSVLATAMVVVPAVLLSRQFGFGGKAAQVPWWSWFGGAGGAVIVLSQPIAAQKLGAGVFIGLTVTAGVVASVLFDHYGLLGFQQHSASWGRIAGAALMVAGVGLVAAF